MLGHLKTQLENFLDQSLKEAFPHQTSYPMAELEIPAEKIHGDFSCNIALKSSKVLKQSPLSVAQGILAIFENKLAVSVINKKILKFEIKNPGFINFYLAPDAFYDILDEVFARDADYGRVFFGQNKKVQVEFVSANPTGPLSVAHARQAAVGDALGNILHFIGFDVTKEYYVNDEGNQINILGQSIKLRALEILGQTIDFPEDHYQGGYIKDMAREYIDKNKIKSAMEVSAKDSVSFLQFGVDYLMNVIRKDLDDFGVHFDVWSRQSKIATNENILTTLNGLQAAGFLYEKDGALWFRSTDFGDDKDRVVRKSDGAFTYLTPDIVYHKDKYLRGFDKIMNIWGPDHHGYIPRIKASIQALGHGADSLEVLIVQLATLYRDGQPLSMSTRRGQFISLREVIDEVGVDAARFFFLMRHINAHLDFDLELAKKETPENPVYYIQYAHARIHSLNKKAREINLSFKRNNFTCLKENEEIELLKQLGIFQDILMFCYDQLDPYPLMSYLQTLATCFHKLYDCHRIVGIDTEIASERLALANATRIVLANGLRLLGVSTPEKM